MISELRVQNFKCLLDVKADLAPFTVLIGPNDSGKSSVLDAIQLALRAATEGSDRLGVELAELVWRRDPQRTIQWTLKGTGAPGGFSYDLAMPRRQNVRESFEGGDLVLKRNEGGGYAINYGERVGLGAMGRSIVEYLLSLHASPQLIPPKEFSALASNARALAAALAPPTKYRLEPEALRQSSTVSENPVLSPTGGNLAAVLDALITGADRSAIISLEKALSDAVPSLSGIALRVVPGTPGTKAVDFVLSGDGPRVTIPASQASEGALLLTAFLALVHGNTPDTLLIEEPENGLHPSRLKTVIDLFRGIAEGRVGNRARQVIVTTHSPILLNYVRPEEVRIVRRDAEKGTQIVPMTAAPDIGKLLEEFAVGELWYLVGEDGLLRGARP
jgi:predicted ATPase